MLYVEPARATTTRCAEPTTEVLDSLHHHTYTYIHAYIHTYTSVVGESSTMIAPTTRFFIPIWTTSLLSRREMRASIRLYAGGGSCSRDLWRAWRIRCLETAEVRMFRELVGRAGCVRTRKKSGWGVFWTISELSASTPTSGRLLQPRARGGDAGRRNKARGGTFHGEMDRCRESHMAGLRHAVVCPNVTGRAKKRIAQSKRAHRADSLAIVD